MKQMLNKMLQELSTYKRDRSELMLHYVSDRLNKSFNEYDKELQQSINYLTKKHEKSLLKRMKKLDG